MASNPRPSRASSTQRVALGLTAAFLVSACAGEQSPGVAVTSTQSDVVFGNTTTPKPSVVQPGQPFVPQGPGIVLPPPPPLSPPDNPFTPPESGPPAGPPPFCPGPPLFATAPEAATTFVQEQPKPGFYLWQLIKAEEVAAGIFSKKARYTNFEVRNVSPVTSRPNPGGEPTTIFTYDQIAYLGNGETLTYTYQVKQNAPGANVGQVSNVGTPRRVSEPDAGVAIKAEVVRNAEGEVLRKFEPLTPVLILPLPIVGGASFVGSGVDPTTGGSLQVQGLVKGPDRVSTCDGFVQGYRVDADVTSQGAEGQAGPVVKQTFTVETQNGGLVVGNVQSTADNPAISDQSIIGDVTPMKTMWDIPKDLRP